MGYIQCILFGEICSLCFKHRIVLLALELVLSIAVYFPLFVSVDALLVVSLKTSHLTHLIEFIHFIL
jgi:hypothetical protein